MLDQISVNHRIKSGYLQLKLAFDSEEKSIYICLYSQKVVYGIIHMIVHIVISPSIVNKYIAIDPESRSHSPPSSVL